MMAIRIQHPFIYTYSNKNNTCSFSSYLSSTSKNLNILSNGYKDFINCGINLRRRRRRSSRSSRFVVRSGSESLGERWEERMKAISVPCLSDVLWPSAGAFAAMALLGRLDQMVASRGLAFTIAPLGAVCAVLFTAPNSPSARKYNMFVAQIGCAAFGVLALSLFGPGWLARGTALAASIAFMTVTGASHPPAASLPLLFIDGAKFHNLNFWYALFPGATGCLLLCLIQEMVTYLKDNIKF